MYVQDPFQATWWEMQLCRQRTHACGFLKMKKVMININNASFNNYWLNIDYDETKCILEGNTYNALRRRAPGQLDPQSKVVHIPSLQFALRFSQ